MEAYFAAKGLDGFANHFNIQALEERDHAYRLFNYVIKLGGKVELADLTKSKTDYDSIDDALKVYLSHEKMITKSINELMDLAFDEKDHSTTSFLSWYVSEQLEEEDSAQKIYDDVKLVEGDGRGLLMIDRELAQRVYTPSVPAE